MPSVGMATRLVPPMLGSSSRMPMFNTAVQDLSPLVSHRTDPSVPFFRPALPNWANAADVGTSGGKGKGRAPASGPEGEEDVDDREWEMRVAQAMLHLRESLPLFFDSSHSTSKLFPPDIFSQNVILKLPPPLPIRISSLPAYSMAFSIARNGMQALHSDLTTSLDRMTLSPSPPPSAVNAALLKHRPPPKHRQKQIRVSLAVYGTPRLPPHKEAIWHTSSLYTCSPYTGLISSHEVETIRPLPGEGVSEWLMNRLLGWTSRQGQGEGAIPCPRTVPLRDRLWESGTRRR